MVPETLDLNIQIFDDYKFNKDLQRSDISPLDHIWSYYFHSVCSRQTIIDNIEVGVNPMSREPIKFYVIEDDILYFDTFDNKLFSVREIRKLIPRLGIN
jgi:hypothetical protein